jgi:hypothetical protein
MMRAMLIVTRVMWEAMVKAKRNRSKPVIVPNRGITIGPAASTPARVIISHGTILRVETARSALACLVYQPSVVPARL